MGGWVDVDVMGGGGRDRENKWDRVSERRCLARVAHANRKDAREVKGQPLAPPWDSGSHQRGGHLGLVRCRRRMGLWPMGSVVGCPLPLLFLL